LWYNEKEIIKLYKSVHKSSEKKIMKQQPKKSSKQKESKQAPTINTSEVTEEQMKQEQRQLAHNLDNALRRVKQGLPLS
jgi:hypothetical protein